MGLVYNIQESWGGLVYAKHLVEDPLWRKIVLSGSKLTNPESLGDTKDNTNENP